MFQCCHPKLTEMDDADIKAIVDSALHITKKVPWTIDGIDEFFVYLRTFGCGIDGRKVVFPDAVIDKSLARIAQVKNAAAPPEPPAAEIQWSVSGQAGLIADTRTDKLRPATKDDLATFCRVVDAIPGMDRSHSTYIPQDGPLKTRELQAFATIVLNSKQPYRVSMYSPEVLPYYMQIMEVALGSREAARAKAREITPAKVWVNTPMMISRENIEAPMLLRSITGQPLDRRVPLAWSADPSDMLDAARQKALHLEQAAPNLCPLDSAQRQEVARIMDAANTALG